MNPLARVIDPLRRSFKAHPVASTQDKPDAELQRERSRRQQEHERTERLAALLDDYRRQDGVLRR